MNDSHKFKRPFWILFWIGLTFKLWLTSTVVINAVFGPHDYYNFLQHGKHVLAGQWFGPYDDLTLIKGPTTPLYIALIRQFGISITLAHQLIYAAAALFVCLAIRPLVRSGWILGSLFLFVLYDPVTFDANAWLINRSQLIDTLGLATVAAAMGIVVRSRASLLRLAVWFVVLGCLIAAFIMTREDTIWIFPPVIVLLAAFVWKNLPARRYRSSLVAVPAVIVALALTTIMTINHRVYGWRTTVETTSAEFTSAYQSWTRIVVPGVDQRAYNAPRAAREMAYRVSAAAAELKPNYDLGGHYQFYACESIPNCHDVTAPWTIWAFRDAVSLAGHYTSGADARAFYVRLSREIDAACADGRLKCTRKSFGLSPPLRWSDLPVTVSYTAKAFAHGMSFDQFELGAPRSMTSQDVGVVPEYESIAGSAGTHLAMYRGWLVHRAGGSIRLDSDPAQNYLSSMFESSPDIRATIGRLREYRNDDTSNARFQIETSCFDNCHLDIDDGLHRSAEIPLDPQTIDFHTPGILYHVDTVTTEPPIIVSDARKNAILAGIAATYQQLVPIGVAFVAFVLLARAYRFVRGRRPPLAVIWWTLSVSVLTAIFAHCAMLGLVCAVSFDALLPEYEAALGALFPLMVAFALATEGHVIVRLLRSKLPVVNRLREAAG